MRLANVVFEGSRRVGLVEPLGGAERGGAGDGDAGDAGDAGGGDAGDGATWQVAIVDAEWSLDDVVRRWPDSLEALVEARKGAQMVPLDALEVRPPIERFNRDILCTGWNYPEHFEESQAQRHEAARVERPERPTFFTKAPGAVIGPYDDIAYDASLSREWDYEAEIALVIGQDGRSIREEDALHHVLGYAVANDVSLRDLQRAYGGQWMKGKSIDSTMPFGPWITTADEVGDPSSLRVTCHVNGELLQDAKASEVAFSFARIVAELSLGMTLRAGDVILTGTPPGVGHAREPKVFLQEGDLVVTRVSGLGELRNRVVATRLS